MFSRVRTASMLRRPASALRQQPRCVGLPAASLHSTAARRGATEDRMKELGIELPAYQDAVWSYVKAQRDTSNNSKRTGLVKTSGLRLVDIYNLLPQFVVDAKV